MKQQLLLINRSRRRAPNLSALDRCLFGFWSLFLDPHRIRRAAVIIRPSTLLKFHRLLKQRKYRLLYSSGKKRKPGPKVLHRNSSRPAVLQRASCAHFARRRHTVRNHWRNHRTPVIRTTPGVEGGTFGPHFLKEHKSANSVTGTVSKPFALRGEFEMHDIYFWTAFFGAPLFLLLVTAFVFRPSARDQYREAKLVIFADEKMAHPRRASPAHLDRRSTQ
jgi:cbb3-type cytochrome oxidase subunit 3